MKQIIIRFGPYVPLWVCWWVDQRAQIGATVALFFFWTMICDSIIDGLGLSKIIYCMERLSPMDRMMLVPTPMTDETQYIFKLKGSPNTEELKARLREHILQQPRLRSRPISCFNSMFYQEVSADAFDNSFIIRE
jgi:hypothetical protein